MPVERLDCGDLRIEGVSRAGEETWFRVRPPGLAFDVGRGALQLCGVPNLFLSHGHLDHSLGLPFLLSHRALHDAGTTRVFAPAPVVAGLTRFVAAAEALENGHYSWEIRALEPGDRVEVGRDLAVEAFESAHAVPSLGYHLLRTKRLLRREFQDRSGPELVQLKREGIEIEREAVELWLSYCGDTGPGVFELEPRILQARVLLIECTFFDEGSRMRGERFGHMHLEDLIGRTDRFENEDLVLHHQSRRYKHSDLTEMLKERLILPATRVHLFGA